MPCIDVSKGHFNPGFLGKANNIAFWSFDRIYCAQLCTFFPTCHGPPACWSEIENTNTVLLREATRARAECFCDWGCFQKHIQIDSSGPLAQYIAVDVRGIQVLEQRPLILPLCLVDTKVEHTLFLYSREEPEASSLRTCTEELMSSWEVLDFIWLAISWTLAHTLPLVRYRILQKQSMISVKDPHSSSEKPRSVYLDSLGRQFRYQHVLEYIYSSSQSGDFNEGALQLRPCSVWWSHIFIQCIFDIRGDLKEICFPYLMLVIEVLWMLVQCNT